MENTENIQHINVEAGNTLPPRGRKDNDEHAHKEEPFDLRVFIKDTFVILLGIAFATIGLELFVVPNKLLDGGVTGISLLLSFMTKQDVSIFIFTINMPFVYMGYKQVGKIFAIKTFLAIVTLSIVLYAMHSLHPDPITKDKVLIAVFGGICLGAGIGFAMRGGCVLDGTEVLALWLTRKTSMQVGEIILIINILISENKSFSNWEEVLPFTVVNVAYVVKKLRRVA